MWVLLSQGRGSTLRKTGWRFYRDPAGSTYSMPDYLTAYAKRVTCGCDRLHGVSLECRDALEVIRDYGTPNVLIYCDPPYLASSRNSTNYRHEMASETQHVEFLEAISECEAPSCSLATLHRSTPSCSAGTASISRRGPATASVMGRRGQTAHGLRSCGLTARSSEPESLFTEMGDMTDVCEFCPFMGCHDCRYQGGGPACPATELRDDRGGKDERPRAGTRDRSSHSDSG